LSAAIGGFSYPEPSDGQEVGALIVQARRKSTEFVGVPSGCQLLNGFAFVAEIQFGQPRPHVTIESFEAGCLWSEVLDFLAQNPSPIVAQVKIRSVRLIPNHGQLPQNASVRTFWSVFASE
jgi:hypothetical protein